MKTINIEIRKGKYETFNIIPIKCGIGDIIWFDDGGSFLEGIVESVEPEAWWIYDDGKKIYGRIIVECRTKNSFYYGDLFTVDACDILYEKPKGYDEYWADEPECEDVVNDISKEWNITAEDIILNLNHYSNRELNDIAINCMHQIQKNTMEE